MAATGINSEDRLVQKTFSLQVHLSHVAVQHARLIGERGVCAAISTLWRFFDARGITVKKDGPRQQA